MPIRKRPVVHDKTECNGAMQAIKDALYALNGKWKLPIIMALSEGPLRFKEVMRKAEGITAKILSKELKELEMNHFVERTVFPTSPVTVEYKLTPYSKTLDKLILELHTWGASHRKYIFSRSKKSKRIKTTTRSAVPA